ncbi:methyltransferase, FkbM family domain protein [Acidisarcina polymorpha]|uniref:Methyltransferase, FkbM family domain protein n=1 Tax=Acidisarcina polymorpha TaxID=2211140 RepID=A0A2Z5FZ31_9BACT|nr:FkbM family methyltransferase [Acidisarcina polymorpha]AXC11665.1 methyltransferase, FkbM family domain protein [Acidisarcina polymorpha]
MSLPGLLRHILDHPMNRGRSLGAISDFLSWQVRSRLVAGLRVIPFVNDSVLMVRRGMHGATLNIYCGLADFSEMSFLLHLLRPEDLFVDVGANVGSYTVLASAAIGARSIAFEPNPETLPGLAANIEANGIGDRVEIHQAGVGAKSGVLRFAANGTQTRIAPNGGASESIFQSPVTTLNETLAASTPALIKIDVEGFESDVLAGAGSVLGRPALLALIIENNEDCVAFGFASDQAHKTLVSYGFVAASYSPLERKLMLVEDCDPRPQNSIYVRSRSEVESRLRSAPAFRVRETLI